jgi:hypothetical protein
MFLLNANPGRVIEAISPDLKPFPGFGNKILFAVLRHEDVHARHDSSGARYAYNEVLLAAIVREKSLNPLGRMGLYPIYLYVDDDTAMAAGRENYGFPKKMARIELAAQKLSLVRAGLVPGTVPGRVQPIELMSAHWSERPRAGRSRTTKSPSSLPSLAFLASRTLFYNTRHMSHPGTFHRTSSELSQLTKVALADVEMRRVSSIHDLRLDLGASVTDPLYRLVQAGSGAAKVTATWGVKVELAFTMGTSRIVEPARQARDRQVLGQISSDGREVG